MKHGGDERTSVCAKAVRGWTFTRSSMVMTNTAVMMSVGCRLIAENTMVPLSFLGLEIFISCVKNKLCSLDCQVKLWSNFHIIIALYLRLPITFTLLRRSISPASAPRGDASVAS